MAVRTPALLADFNYEQQRIHWAGLLNTDSGAPIEYGFYSDRSVQVVGTFGAGGSVTLQGSNDGGTTWATLLDPAGAALTFTATGLRQVVTLPALTRPLVTAGDGTTSLNVYLFMVGKRR
jgi:hypothetical protein